MTNIALFDKHVAIILSHLDTHFPTPWECECQRIFNYLVILSF